MGDGYNLLKLRKESGGVAERKAAGARLEPGGVSPSRAAQRVAGEHSRRLARVRGSELTGFRGGATESSPCTHRAEAASIPYWQLCRKPILEPCSAPGSSFCLDQDLSWVVGRSSSPSHVHGFFTHQSLPCFKCCSLTVGACQQQNQPEALAPCIRSALGRVVLRKNPLQKRRCFQLGAALVKVAPEPRVPPQPRGRQEGGDAPAWRARTTAESCGLGTCGWWRCHLHPPSPGWVGWMD